MEHSVAHLRPVLVAVRLELLLVPEHRHHLVVLDHVRVQDGLADDRPRLVPLLRLEAAEHVAALLLQALKRRPPAHQQHPRSSGLKWPSGLRWHCT